VVGLRIESLEEDNDNLKTKNEELTDENDALIEQLETSKGNKDF